MSYCFNPDASTEMCIDNITGLATVTALDSDIGTLAGDVGTLLLSLSLMYTDVHTLTHTLTHSHIRNHTHTTS
jgi:hypothetical protein